MDMIIPSSHKDSDPHAGLQFYSIRSQGSVKGPWSTDSPRATDTAVGCRPTSKRTRRAANGLESKEKLTNKDEMTHWTAPLFVQALQAAPIRQLPSFDPFLSTQNATPTESPDTSETTQDAAPTPSPTTRGPTAEIPTSPNDDGAYLSDLIEQLSTAQGSGEHCRLEDCRHGILQKALYALQVVPFLGDGRGIVYGGLWAAQKELGYTPLDSSTLYKELVDSKYEEWIDDGGPRKPTPKVVPIRKMYLCVNWISKDRPEIELTHELVYLCLKDYTGRNSMFHSELGADGVDGNAEKIEGVFDRDMKRTEHSGRSQVGGGGKYHEGCAEGQSKLLPIPSKYKFGPPAPAASRRTYKLSSPASAPRRRRLNEPWRNTEVASTCLASKPD